MARVVTSDGDVALDTAEDGIVADDMTGCSHPMKHVREILQLAAKGLADGLMTQAHTQYRLLAGIGLDHIEQQSCLRGDTRSRREDDLTKRLQILQFELVVTHHGDLSA